MRLSIVLLSLFFFISSIYGFEADIPQNDVPIGAKKITTYKEERNDEKLKNSVQYFDRVGRKKKEQTYDSDGNLLRTVFYTYNESGHLEEKKAVNNRNNTEWRTDYIYDEEGRLIREIEYSSTGHPNYTKVNEYQGDRTETLMYNSEGFMLWRKKSIEDTERGVKEAFSYYPDGTRIKGVIKEYNEKNQLFKELHIDEIGAVFRRIETEFDRFDRIVEREVYDHRGTLRRWVKVDYLANGFIDTIRQGFPQQEQEEVFSYTYRFDERGSWVYREETITVIEREENQRRILSREKKYRTIEYYNYQIEGKP